MLKSNKVYLIGFMGSGKSTTGAKLANLLGWTFLDLDTCIEKHAGMKIPEIFSAHGESYFREIESRVLKNLEPLTRVVISTGGGTPCFGDNMMFMRENGLTIYLRLTPSQLESRLSASDADRPLIRDIGRKDLLSFITEKLALREKWYEMAEITFNGFDTDARLLCTLIRPLIES